LDDDNVDDSVDDDVGDDVEVESGPVAPTLTRDSKSFDRFSRITSVNYRDNNRDLEKDQLRVLIRCEKNEPSIWKEAANLVIFRNTQESPQARVFRLKYSGKYSG